MGQQQLLLIVLGMIIIGVAILMGITLYRTHAVQAKKDSLIDDCAGIGTLAQKYYWTPKMMGGGGQNFSGFEIPLDFLPTANGHYRISSRQDTVLEITATGNEVVTDSNDSVTVVINILPRNYKIVSTIP